MSYFGVAPIQSDVNYSITPLSASATYTGDWELTERSMVLVQLFADVAGTLYFDFSIDGVNADSTFPASGFAASANTTLVEPATVNGRYFRVRYVNSSVAQTEFRLRAFYGDLTNFYAPYNQGYNQQSPAILTRSTWPWLDVARGLVGGVTSVKKFGRNSAVGTSFVPVCLGGEYQTPQASGATQLRIKAGGNANDTAAGTGAREITLIGLDENFTEITETLATNGASASSATTASFTRLYTAYVSQSGTYATASVGSHAGNIVIENSGAGTDWLTIDATDFPKSQSEVGAFSIPANKKAVVKLRGLSIDSGKTIDLAFFVRQNINQTSAPYSAMKVQSVLTGVSGGSIEHFGATDVPFGIYEGATDVGFLAKVSSGTASVSVELEVILLDD